MLKRVRELPKPKSPAGRESIVAKDVREFCRNTTYDVAEVINENSKSPKALVDSLRQYIRLHPEQCKGIGAALRDGKAYLYRKGVMPNERLPRERERPNGAAGRGR